MATVIASLFMMVFYFFMLFDKKIKDPFKVFSAKLNKETLVKQIKLAVPQGAQEVFTMSGYCLLYTSDAADE